MKSALMSQKAIESYKAIALVEKRRVEQYKPEP